MLPILAVFAVVAAAFLGLWFLRTFTGWFSSFPRGARGLPRRSTAVTSIATPRFDDNVQFTVHRPHEIEPGQWYLLLAFVHLADKRPDEPDAADPVADVDRQARLLLENEPGVYRAMREDSLQAIPRSGNLTLIPEMDGVEFNPPQIEFRWEQPVHRAEFRLRSLPGSVPRTAHGRLTILWGSVIVGDVALAIRVVAEIVESRLPVPADTSRPYRKIFASYSHRDADVVDQFDGFIEALGDRYLRDVRDLRAGQVWSEELEHLIEAADVFQLFWSWNALESPFVRKEWEFALGLERSGFVRPVYWEEPLPASNDLPPEALRRLHFYHLSSVRSHVSSWRRGGLPSTEADRKPRLGRLSTPIKAAATMLVLAVVVGASLMRVVIQDTKPVQPTAPDIAGGGPPKPAAVPETGGSVGTPGVPSFPGPAAGTMPVPPAATSQHPSASQPLPPEGADKDQIQRLIASYCMAYESRSVPGVARLYPAVDRNALAALFKAVASVDCHTTAAEFVRLDVASGSALVRFSMTLRVQRGNLTMPQTTTRTVNMLLSRREGRWLIDRVDDGAER